MIEDSGFNSPSVHLCYRQFKREEKLAQKEERLKKRQGKLIKKKDEPNEDSDEESDAEVDVKPVRRVGKTKGRQLGKGKLEEEPEETSEEEEEDDEDDEDSDGNCSEITCQGRSGPVVHVKRIVKWPVVGFSKGSLVSSTSKNTCKSESKRKGLV